MTYYWVHWLIYIPDTISHCEQYDLLLNPLTLTTQQYDLLLMTTHHRNLQYDLLLGTLARTVLLIPSATVSNMNRPLMPANPIISKLIPYC